MDEIVDPEFLCYERRASAHIFGKRATMGLGAKISVSRMQSSVTSIFLVGM